MEEPSASGAEGGAEEMEHDEADGEADVAPLSSNISLLLDLAQAQAEHGLRHGDYTRYRRVRPQLALRCQGARRSQLTRQPPPWWPPELLGEKLSAFPRRLRTPRPPRCLCWSWTASS